MLIHQEISGRPLAHFPRQRHLPTGRRRCADLNASEASGTSVAAGTTLRGLLGTGGGVLAYRSTGWTHFDEQAPSIPTTKPPLSAKAGRCGHEIARGPSMQCGGTRKISSSDSRNTHSQTANCRAPAGASAFIAAKR